MDNKGYTKFRLLNKWFSGHGLVAITFLNYKQKPGLVIDHIDSNKSNNSVDNLRIISFRQNISKEKKLKRNLPTGVYRTKNNKSFYSMLNINSKLHYLGQFSTPEEASQAYENKVKQIDLC